MYVRSVRPKSNTIRIRFPRSQIEDEEIETADMNQIKYQGNNNTLTAQECMATRCGGVRGGKKSSSSSRLVIYFSVITQTFKRAYTRVHEYKNENG